MELRVDPSRVGETGIFIRAKLNGVIGSYDIYRLDKDSFLTWLRSCDKMPDKGASWRENIILTIMRHT